MCRGPCGPNRLQESPDPEKPWTACLLSILLSLGNLGGNLGAPGARRTPSSHPSESRAAGTVTALSRCGGCQGSSIRGSLLPSCGVCSLNRLHFEQDLGAELRLRFSPLAHRGQVPITAANGTGHLLLSWQLSHTSQRVHFPAMPS